jgi:hypothetical protein
LSLLNPLSLADAATQDSGWRKDFLSSAVIADGLAKLIFGYFFLKYRPIPFFPGMNEDNPKTSCRA